jgi:hypothetical protein
MRIFFREIFARRTRAGAEKSVFPARKMRPKSVFLTVFAPRFGSRPARVAPLRRESRRGTALVSSPSTPA